MSFRTPLPVTGMVTELLRDNSTLIEAMGDPQVSSIINLLSVSKNPEYLELLAVLCVCEESAVPGKQALITQKLLRESLHVLFMTKFNRQTREVLLNVSGRKDDWQSLEK